MNRNREDELISLRDACREIPGTPHLSTVYRWVKRGVGGVRLEAARVGGRLFVRRAAIREFIRETNSVTRRPSTVDAENLLEQLRGEGF